MIKIMKKKDLRLADIMSAAAFSKLDKNQHASTEF